MANYFFVLGWIMHVPMISYEIGFRLVKVLIIFVSELVVKIDLAGENLVFVGRVACNSMTEA
jgi:hypothetical protein